MGERERIWAAAVVAAAVILTFYRLGAGTLWDQDETKYAEVAREILQTGDPITLHVNGDPWYVHPPLYMWLVAATGRAAGFSTFTVRFWSGVASVATVYATMLLGRELFNARTGILAGAALAVTFHFLVQSRLAVFDTVLLAFMLAAAYSAVRAYREKRRADALRFFVFAGLATLTKGPIGLVLPGLVMAAFVTVRRAWSRRREVPWAAGFALYALIGLSWYGAETLLHGGEFARSVLVYYGVGRFFGVVENQAGPWHYYIPVLAAGAFPWTAFWPAAAVWHARRLRDHDGSLFVGLWCAIVVVFYSIAQTKLPNYVLPVYPLAAVGVAALWDAALGPVPADRAPTPRGANMKLTPAGMKSAAAPAGAFPTGRGGGAARLLAVSTVLLAVLVAGLYAGIGGYLSRLYPAQFREYGHALLVPAVALAAGVAAAIVLIATGRRGAAFAALCAAVALSWLGTIRWIVPLVEAQKPMPVLARAIAAAWRPGDRILGYRLDIYSSLIYYSGHTVQWIDTPLALANAVCLPGRAFVVIAGSERPRVALPKDVSVLSARGGIDVLVKPADLVCP